MMLLCLSALCSCVSSHIGPVVVSCRTLSTAHAPTAGYRQQARPHVQRMAPGHCAVGRQDGEYFADWPQPLGDMFGRLTGRESTFKATGLELQSLHLGSPGVLSSWLPLETEFEDDEGEPTMATSSPQIMRLVRTAA